jgi:hypothetical protein
MVQAVSVAFCWEVRMLVRNKWMGSLAFAALLCAPAAGQSQKPYVNAQYKFTVTPPSGWAINNPADVVVVFIEPITNDSAISHGKESNKQFLERINKQYGQKAAASQGFRSNVTITTAAVPPGTATLADYAKLSRTKAASLRSWAACLQLSGTFSLGPPNERRCGPERFSVFVTGRFLR